MKKLIALLLFIGLTAAAQPFTNITPAQAKAALVAVDTSVQLVISNAWRMHNLATTNVTDWTYTTTNEVGTITTNNAPKSIPDFLSALLNDEKVLRVWRQRCDEMVADIVRRKGTNEVGKW